MKSLISLIYAEVLAVIRDKATLAFTFAFPVVFVLIFGPLMSGISSSQTVNLGLVITGEASADVLKEIVSQVGTIMITDLPNKEALEEALGKQDVDFGLVWNGSLLTFSYDPARIQDNYAFQELARGIASKFELRHQELYPILGVDKVHVGKPSASNWFNLAVPGVMAFSILSGGLFAVSGHLTAMKQRKLLDRLIVTPMRPIALLVAIATVRLVIIYFSSLITLLTAIIILRLTFDVDWLNYTVFVLAATAGSMGFGTVIALLVRSPSSASNLGYITSIMMMFLAGIYFPIEVMPAYLRTLSKFLPLTYMANAMRYATGVSEMSSSRFWAITASLGLVFLVSFPLLARYVVRADRA